MLPRPVACDDIGCDYGDRGRWRHEPGCWAAAGAWIDDAAQATATLPPEYLEGLGRRTARPNRTDGRDAA